MKQFYHTLDYKVESDNFEGIIHDQSYHFNISEFSNEDDFEDLDSDEKIITDPRDHGLDENIPLLGSSKFEAKHLPRFWAIFY